ncbi:Arylsulfatase [Dyadobacter sp. CECT 9275]|uniref:Arylsulfatase n=1 Tax=Dyadobacter helix TaxID=2822344 RepID=A0A916JFJ6_9BACT|nr:sulfatase-like hydrolase/transferase [Dyadobacter sp. CECT 9275]CAG5000092.1 Arylsulfatase [Dyadobacter sp. CECT 9275]
MKTLIKNHRTGLRRLLFGITLSISAVLTISSIRHPSPEMGAAEKPNIIFIYTDDQRYNTIHALGNGQIITPNLDSLAAAGTTFTHAYNMGAWHGAVCVASRTMLVTGFPVWKAQQQEKKLGTLMEKGGFWSQQLKKAGYETYMTGKWHVRADVNKLFDHVIHERPGMPNQTPKGYNRPLAVNDTAWQPWDEENGGFWKGGKHWSEVLADDAVGYIQEASRRESPFFMYLAFNAPHDPRQAPKKFVDMYPVEKIVLPDSYLDEYPFKDAMGCGADLRDEQLAPFPRTPYAVKKHIQEYYASITHLDEQIGRILQALRKSGKMENTYLFFTSDHGLSVGHHGLLGKQSMFDHSVRTPLIVAGPGIPKHEKRDQQVYLQDIMATTYELAAVPKPQHVFFNSLLPLIKNKNKTSQYTGIYGCYMDTQRMVRTDRYKLIYYPKINKTLLFDLRNDPGEKKDIAGSQQNKGLIRDLKNRLLAEQKMMGDTLLLKW